MIKTSHYNNNAAHVTRCLLFLLLTLSSHFNYALEKTDHLLSLQANIPPSFYANLISQPVFNVKRGTLRFIPRVNAASISAISQKLTTYHDSWKSQPLPFIVLSSSVCHCSDFLLENEYLVSEIPIKNEDGSYLSINDESYKAMMELINYPFDNVELTTVALSELAYVYNIDAMEEFLELKNFELLMSSGFMNSLDYPGYRDTQFVLIRSVANHQVYLVIRGTSGTADVEVNLDVQLVPWGQHGLAHGGYADIASFILNQIKPYLSKTADPWVITGHSLGGSVAMLISLRLLDNHINVVNINYAPAPALNHELRNYYQDITGKQITNVFLPNEELDVNDPDDQVDDENWLYLTGQYAQLDDVGTTAGAAHFVINYLKSRLLQFNLSRADYEAGLPHCVVIKYNCFSSDHDVSISACSLFSDDCFWLNSSILFGFNGSPTSDELDLLALENRRKLIGKPLDAVQQVIILYRLAFLSLMREEDLEAQRYIGIADELIAPPEKPEGYRGIINQLFRSPMKVRLKYLAFLPAGSISGDKIQQRDTYPGNV